MTNQLNKAIVNDLLSDFNISTVWNEHWIINSLRLTIRPLVEQKLEKSDILFDPQDLEHQVLFFLTTFNPSEISEKNIKDAVEQQYKIIRKRILDSGLSVQEICYIFRGLKFFYPDLNVKYRLKLKWFNGYLKAVGDGRNFDIEFKKITDQKIIELFTGTFHYIHQTRVHGEAFAFYFKGDKYPWAIETTESSRYSREYKRQALLHNGIDPNYGIELTRYYTLPGAPINSISIIDKLVKDYYQKNNPEIKVIFTTTMPSYSKSKSTTISGGINNVLCVKDLKHYFVPVVIDGVECWQHVSKRWLEVVVYKDRLKCTHDQFYLYPKVDMYMRVDAQLGKVRINSLQSLCPKL